MTDNIKTADLYDCNVPYLKTLFENSVYPWDMLDKITDLCNELCKSGLDGFTEIKPGVLVGKDVTIADTAVICAPAVIGNGCEIRPGAFIRGSVITGEGCVLGNSSEFKNCILLDGVQAPHYNYVGDSVLGNRAHMGAGSICSNLKSGGSEVVIHASEDIKTGRRKIGGILADYADIGCGCVINPGTVVGKRTAVYPLIALRGVIPGDSIVKTLDNIVIRKNK